MRRRNSFGGGMPGDTDFDRWRRRQLGLNVVGGGSGQGSTLHKIVILINDKAFKLIHTFMCCPVVL